MMTFVILLYLFDLGMILSENRYPLSGSCPGGLREQGSRGKRQRETGIQNRILGEADYGFC